MPLEKGYDYLRLSNGQKIEIPFRTLIVFSTNLDPADLVDEAFLRRIKYKIEVGDPTMEQFNRLFHVMCKRVEVQYHEEGYNYLVDKWYAQKRRPLRFVHPRDLLKQMKDIATYLGVEPTMGDRRLIDYAASSYFVDLSL